ncbi:hypothetical protein [Sphingobacterium sp. LRF_L2]|uniref:hypothetical protein n=1 Tax=Sphingobacterium sp. LRF_L2 TaxID=3369421 RepID=UPI003F608849
MAVNILINSYELTTAFGVYLEDGGLSEFEQPPVPKVPFYQEWADESGREYDTTSAVVYECRYFEIPFLIKGKDMQDYRKKKTEFLSLIDQNDDVDFQVVDWGETYRLRYVSAKDWKFINEGLTTKTSARFVIRFEDNHGTPSYIFKYLADNYGRYIVINGGQKILVKTSL